MPQSKKLHRRQKRLALLKSPKSRLRSKLNSEKRLKKLRDRLKRKSPNNRLKERSKRGWTLRRLWPKLSTARWKSQSLSSRLVSRRTP